MHTRVSNPTRAYPPDAGGCVCFTVQLSWLHHTHHTPLWRRRQPRGPTKAHSTNKGRRRGKRKPMKREKGPNDGLASFGPLVRYFLFFFCFFMLTQLC